MVKSIFLTTVSSIFNSLFDWNVSIASEIASFANNSANLSASFIGSLSFAEIALGSFVNPASTGSNCTFVKRHWSSTR